MGVCGSTNDKPNNRIQKQNNITPKENTPSTYSDLTTVEKEIFKLKICRDQVKSYIKQLNEKEKIQREKAKDYLKDNERERAKLCLNKRKMYRSHADGANGQLNMLEEQLAMIESTKNQADIAKTLEQGNKILKQLQDEVNIERMEAIKDDMDELKDKHNELTDFFKNHGIDIIEEDEDLDKEIELLQLQDSKKLDQQFPELKEKEVIDKENTQSNVISNDRKKEAIIA